MFQLQKMDGLVRKNLPQPEIREVVSVPIGKDCIWAEFVTFKHLSDQKEHLALCFGDWRKQSRPLVRVHSECLTGDVFFSAKCDCGQQLEEGLHLMRMQGGIILYLRQEGRGIGLYNKIDAYALQAKGFDTYVANNLLLFKDDLRSYQCAAEMLHALGKRNIRLLSNNPDKAEQLEKFGIEIDEKLYTGTFSNEHNKAYLNTKRQKTKHTLNLGEAP